MDNSSHSHTPFFFLDTSQFCNIFKGKKNESLTHRVRVSVAERAEMPAMMMEIQSSSGANGGSVNVWRSLVEPLCRFSDEEGCAGTVSRRLARFQWVSLAASNGGDWRCMAALGGRTADSLRPSLFNRWYLGFFLLNYFVNHGISSFNFFSSNAWK